ncbi:hypothetical protein, partial [Thermococcus sp.]|uniref:hypothetical protein n=1 Tax=Thermococcus sp. TaxID=35749 RepID=UPI0026092880
PTARAKRKRIKREVAFFASTTNPPYGFSSTTTSTDQLPEARFHATNYSPPKPGGVISWNTWVVSKDLL